MDWELCNSPFKLGEGTLVVRRSSNDYFCALPGSIQKKVKQFIGYYGGMKSIKKPGYYADIVDHNGQRYTLEATLVQTGTPGGGGAVVPQHTSGKIYAQGERWSAVCCSAPTGATLRSPKPLLSFRQLLLPHSCLSGSFWLLCLWIWLSP